MHSEIDILTSRERLDALERTQLLDSIPEEAFDRFTRLASRLLNVPISLITLVDGSRQFFKSVTGSAVLAEARETPFSHSFCKHVVGDAQPLIVHDARSHPVLSQNGAVADYGVVAYAGVPLCTGDGHVLGSFCAIDTAPRRWTDEEVELLSALASSVMSEVEWRRHAAENEAATAALRRSEALHRSVVESANDAILVVDGTGRIHSWNHGAREIFGYDDAILGRPMDVLIPPRYREAHRMGMANYRPGAPSRVIGRTVEIMGLRGSGEEFPIELSITPWTSEGETFFTGIIRDVTSRRETEAAREQAERDYRGLFEHAQDAIVVLDLDEKVLDANPRACELYGYAPGELIGGSMERVSVDVAHGRRELREALDGRSSHSFEIEQRRSDGSRLFVEVTAAVVEYGGRPAVLSINRDVTERRAAECARVESEAQFRAIFDEAPIGMALVDLRGRPVRSNRALRHMLDCTDRELCAMEFAEFVPAAAAGAGAGDETARVEHRFARRDGTELRGVVSVSLLHWGAGAPRYAIAMVENVTEQREAEEALEQNRLQLLQAQKMEAVGRLAGGVAHDFNNLLTVILGNTQLLLGDLPPAPEGGAVREDLEEIERVARKAADLTGQLLAFSRQQVLRPRVLDLQEVFASTDRLLRRLLGEDVDVRTRFAKGLGRVKADPGQLEQVLVNLAVNARDAMPAGGRLTIDITNTEVTPASAARHPAVPYGSYALLSVTDTGTGMDEETRARIFEPFFTTKVPGRGTGLGLSTVYGIVKQSGGRIRVQSQLGLGTTFRVYLPRVDEALAAGAAALAPESGGSETILLVEDEESVRGVARRILVRAGYTVLEARDGGEAHRVAAAHAGPIDLLLVDVVMPGASGPQVARELEAMRPGAGILLMSGYTDDVVVHRGVMEEGVPFLQKPFMPDELLRGVRGGLNRDSAAAA